MRSQAKPKQAWNKPIGNRDYTLVRLSSTLYSLKQKHAHYQDVKLIASMVPLNRQGDVTAYTLYPDRITSTRQGKVSVKLTPQLKFVEAIDAKLGEAGVEIDYPYALPVVQAYGQGQSQGRMAVHASIRSSFNWGFDNLFGCRCPN